MSNYSNVTELPGTPVAKHAIDMTAIRYQFALEYCQNNRVLEIACGGGQGLGIISKKASRVVGTDIDEHILEIPKKYYSNRENINLEKVDASNLPYPDGSFDTIIIFEAIYYFPNLKNVLSECKRVLSNKGILVICSVNPQWHGFNPSEHSYKYYSLNELEQLTTSEQLTTIKKQVGFYDSPDRLIAQIKKFATKYHLIPKTMKGKKLLKRLFFGKLIPFPNEITESDLTTNSDLITPIQDNDFKNHIVFYLACKK